MANDGFHVELYDHVTGDEIDDVEFSRITNVPRAGEQILYWQDGTPEKAGGGESDVRRFLVMGVKHDWRYMPARNGGGTARYIESVILNVLAQGDAEEFPAPPRKRRPTHPGAVIAESLDAIGLSPEKAAAKIGVPQSYLKQVIKGEAGIPAHMAKKFGHLFGNGASLWIRMQAAADLWDAEHGDAAG